MACDSATTENLNTDRGIQRILPFPCRIDSQESTRVRGSQASRQVQCEQMRQDICRIDTVCHASDRAAAHEPFVISRTGGALTQPADRSYEIIEARRTHIRA